MEVKGDWVLEDTVRKMMKSTPGSKGEREREKEKGSDEFGRRVQQRP